MDRIFQRQRWQMLAAIFCFLFGVAFTLNIHPIGDGLWFWYAALMRGGHRLYADMHLPLQPLFVLLTAWTQRLLGDGWIASKVLAFAQLFAYCLALFLINGLLLWKDWQKGILIVSAFSMTIPALYFRFDDYHVTGYCFEVYSIYLLLRISEEKMLTTAGILGALAGLSIGNRLNDGGALFATCGIALLALVPRRKLAAACIFCGTTGFVLLGLILLTGDSVRDWATNSIFHAVAIKGSTESTLLAPLIFPRRMFTELHHDKPYQRDLACVILLTSLVVLVWYVFRRSNRRIRMWHVAAVACILGGLAILTRYHEGSWNIFEPLAALGVPVSLGLSLWVMWRVVRVLFFTRPADWHPRELVLLIPILQIPAGAVTSGKSVLEVYPAVAVLLLILPLVLRDRRWREWQKIAFLTVSIVIATSVLWSKTTQPYHWGHFTDRALFVDREWYRHPVYGEMYIERDQLELMRNMCAKMDADGPATELLSITNPYPNYFCNVTPWHGYVQTWYDTSSKDTIDTLIGELKIAPPKWIVYQRAEDVMELHEMTFLGGRPLPHRALDKLILDHLAQGTWKMEGAADFEGAEWLVIRTRP